MKRGKIDISLNVHKLATIKIMFFFWKKIVSKFKEYMKISIFHLYLWRCHPTVWDHCQKD